MSAVNSTSPKSTHRTPALKPVKSALVRLIEAWLLRNQQPQRIAIRLEHRRIYILPTRYGCLFALMLMIMLLWSINYSNSMGFALTFLLGAVALNAMWRSHANLLALQVHPLPVAAVFAGQPARFTYRVANPDAQTRYGIALQGQYADIPAQGSSQFTVTVAAQRRGLLKTGRLCIATRFPLGLFQAWSWLEFEQACIVYPKPHGGRPLPVRSADRCGSGVDESGIGSEDYAGLRAYAPGDSPRHIAWKAAARGSGLLVKRFTEQVRPQLWLDWHLLVPDPIETRLSQLCQWVLKAEAEEREYGLRLPGLEVPPGKGQGQRRCCLEALALYCLADEAKDERR